MCNCDWCWIRYQPRSVSYHDVSDFDDSGINLEFARLLLKGGCNVLFADLGLRPEAESLVREYANSPKAIFQKTDVTLWNDLDAMMKAAEDSFGQIDIVCPGAGVFEPPWSNFWRPPGTAESKDSPAGNSYKMLDINITYPIRVTQLAIQYFLKNGVSLSNPKTIVHIASTAGESASLPFPMYHASKWASKYLQRHSYLQDCNVTLKFLLTCIHVLGSDDF